MLNPSVVTLNEVKSLRVNSVKHLMVRLCSPWPWAGRTGHAGSTIM